MWGMCQWMMSPMWGNVSVDDGISVGGMCLWMTAPVWGNVSVDDYTNVGECVSG